MAAKEIRRQFTFKDQLLQRELDRLYNEIQQLKKENADLKARVFNLENP